MISVLSFANKRFENSIKRLEKSVYKVGLDNFISYTPDMVALDEDFMLRNKVILQQKRGYGYWLWKPYIIRKHLLELKNQDDILFYCDAGAEFMTYPEFLIEKCKNQDHLVAFGTNHINLKYIKYDCYKIMGLTSEEYYQAPLAAAGYMLLRKTPFNINFINEWFKYAQTQNPEIITDSPSILGQERSEFIDNRHDQAVFSLLIKKYNIETFRDPAQYGNPYPKQNSPYPQIFHLHRSKNKLDKMFPKEKIPFSEFWKTHS